ncbi:hypothetical protein PQX77_021792, partial [Marasmius sp. AFHP31]
IKQWIFDIGDSVCPLVGNWEVVKVTERGVEAVRSYWVSDGSKKQKVEEARFLGWGAQKIWKIGHVRKATAVAPQVTQSSLFCCVHYGLTKWLS